MHLQLEINVPVSGLAADGMKNGKVRSLFGRIARRDEVEGSGGHIMIKLRGEVGKII